MRFVINAKHNATISLSDVISPFLIGMPMAGMYLDRILANRKAELVENFRGMATVFNYFLPLVFTSKESEVRRTHYITTMEEMLKARTTRSFKISALFSRNTVKKSLFHKSFLQEWHWTRWFLDTLNQRMFFLSLRNRTRAI